jgi:hypothetical protein
MAVASQTAEGRARAACPDDVPRGLSRLKRGAFLLLVNLFVFMAIMVAAEVGFRLFWNPRYWIHCNRLLVGSGQTEVGKKWWPDTTYAVDGSEFHLLFQTNASGYRARSQPVTAGHPYRIALVGDSFTEAMQVPYDSTFCARVEVWLNRAQPSRTLVCENFGISATDLFDYWHRIIHDVLPGNPPDALLLCIFPGNDFQGILPDDGFDAGGRPLRDYFRKPAWTKHLVAWINLHSKFGFFAQRALLCWDSNVSRQVQGPKNWWTDPKVAASAGETPALKRSRSLLVSIDEECRRYGTRLCILVVGPVANYTAKGGQSPLARILAQWGVDIPVIDVAIKLRARRDWDSLLFPYDGHLTEAGHAAIAAEAAPLLKAFLTGTNLTTLHR